MAEATSPAMKTLLDKEAIKEMVVNSYYLVDEGDVDGAMENWTEDATFDAGAFGQAEGKEAIREMVTTLFDEELLFTKHMIHMPLIEVDGDEATGKWYLDCPSITGDGEAIWLQGTYEHEYRRVGDEWKFSSFTFDGAYATPFDQGWAEQPFVEGMPGELDW